MARQSELRLMTICPDIERVFVLEFTNAQGVAEMIGGVNKQVQGHHILTILTTRVDDR